MKNLKSQIRNTKAFSLIELVFAMVFLTIIVFGVVNLQSSNLGMLNNQNREIQAHFLANQGLQVVKAIGYATISGVCSGAERCKILFADPDYQVQPIPVWNAGSGENIDDLDLFERSFTIDATNLTSALLIKMEVSWDDEEFRVSTKQIIY